MSFDFSSLPLPDGYRRTYEGTLDAFRRGLLSHGLMWELAKHDEVFAARLRREEIGKP